MAYDFNTWASQYNLTDAQKASVQSTLTNPEYIQKTRPYNLYYGDAADELRARDAAIQLGILNQSQSGGQFGDWTTTNTGSGGSTTATPWGTTGAAPTGLIDSPTGVTNTTTVPSLAFGQPNPNGATPGGAGGFGPAPRLLPDGSVDKPYGIGLPDMGQAIATASGTAPINTVGAVGVQPGLIDTTKGYDPTAWNVDPNQTVQGQVRNIIDENGPLQQQAATLAKQQANERGLANTTMAVSAGQDALYRAALPIAQQDAAMFGRAAETNAAAKTSASQFLAASLNQKTLTQAQLDQQANIANADNQLKAATANLDASTRLQLQDMQSRVQASIANADNATKLQITGMTTQAQLGMAQIEAQYKTVMQVSASASDMYSKGMNMLTQIMLDPNLDAASKQSAINNIVSSLATGLQITGSINGIDFGTLLDFA